jgi:hypothetical protein
MIGVSRRLGHLAITEAVRLVTVLDLLQKPPSPTLVAALAALLLAACDGPTPPVRVASPAPIASSAAPAGASAASPPAAASAAPPSASAAPPPAAAGTPCEGSEVDLAAAFASEACYAPAATVGAEATKLPAGIEVTLASDPAKLANREHARATLSVRNPGTERAVVYFHPLGSDISVLLDLVDPRTRDRHREAGTAYPVPAGPPRLARITLAPGGRATLTLPWAAERKTGGHPPPRARPDSVPLTPGAYLLTAWTGLPGLSPKDPDQTREPAASITIR